MSPTRQISPRRLFLQSRSGSCSVDIELVSLFRRSGAGRYKQEKNVVCCAVKLLMPGLLRMMRE